MSDYSYQKQLIDSTFRDLLKHHKVVLAACPAAGKTRMATEIVQRLFKLQPDANALVFTHGQLILRDQWHEVIAKCMDEHAVITKSKEAIDHLNNARMVLSLPQTLRNAQTTSTVTLLIVDEAHQRFFSKEMQKLISQLKPTYILCLTGTPSPFIGDETFKINGITIEELLPYGTLADPMVEIVETEYLYTFGDYNPETRTLSNKIFDYSETQGTLDKLLAQLCRKLSSPHRTDPERFKWLSVSPDWYRVSKYLQKTMVICHNQSHARDVLKYFTTVGVKAVMSICGDSDGSAEAHQFMTDPHTNIFIVVHRGILGFNYPDLMNVVDLSGSLNINRLFQALCRIVRRAPNSEQRKLFIKGANVNTVEITYFVMSYVMALSSPDYYYSYHTNTKQIPVDPAFVRLLRKLTKLPEKTAWPYEKDEPKKFPPLPELYTFSELSRKRALGTVAYTDFATVLNSLYGNRQQWTVEKALQHAMLYKTRKAFEKGCPGAWAHLMLKGELRLLDGVFGERVRWTEALVKQRIDECDTLGELRRRFKGAYTWIVRNGKTSLLYDAYGYVPSPGKGRANNSKISIEIAKQIRDEYKRGNITYGELSRRYNLSQANISHVINHKMWKSD